MGAATEQKFFFRTNIYDDGEPVIEELYLRELFEGNVRIFSEESILTFNQDKFVGLKKLLTDFVEINKEKLEQEKEEFGSCPIEQIFATYDYLTKLSTGEVPTNSTYIREFVRNHEEYKLKKDSIVTEVRISSLNFF